jgi:hypothetical protein
MKKSVTLILAFVGAMVAGACSSGGGGAKTGSQGSGANGGASTNGPGAGAGTTTTQSGSPGSTGTGGNTTTSTSTSTTSASSSGALPTCSNTDLSIIPIDSTGWVPRNCDNYGIQGAWYCYTDGFGSTSCMTGMPPYSAASPGPGMCISGMTASTTTNTSAYGAAIGFSLNDSGGKNSVKGAWNATMYGVTGFEVTLTGNTGGLPVRIGFTQAAMTNNPAPFVEVPGPSTATPTVQYMISFASANVPSTWNVPNKGQTVDPTMIYDLQFQIAAGAMAENYNFCVTSLKPIGSSSSSSSSSSGGCGTLTNFGSAQCGGNGNLAITDMTDYGVQNDFYNGSGTECLQAMQNGNCAGFTLTPMNVSAPGGGAPASYPSLIYGWHYGNFHGGYKSAKQLSAVTSVPTTWAFSPGSGNWDASYDIWLHPSSSNPPNPNGGVEMMIWADHNNATPFGSQQGSVMIGNINWAIWKGQQQGWTYIAYVAPSGTTNHSVNLDLKSFFSDSVSRGWMTNSWYLLGVECGYELWNATSVFSTTSYTCAIN